MSATIEVENLRVGMFIHLDLGWWAHPFALSSFMLASPEQIATVRGLGLKRVRWSPEKSRIVETVDAAPADDDADTAALQAVELQQQDAQARHRADLAAQRAASRLCQAQYGEAGRAWKQAVDQVQGQPVQARQTTEALTQSLIDKLTGDREICIRALNEGLGDRAGAHALNVTVISMLMGRVFGFAEQDMHDMATGALMHDIGKLELPDRVRHSDGQFSHAELAAYCSHVGHGLAHGQRMGLSAGALQVLGQHHEMADGSGFPQKLNLDRMAAASRIVSLANRFDNLCNPLLPSHALTPHEALSLIFAQAKSKFDSTMLNAFIRMMGVYPPGSTVQLTDDRFGTVVSVNSSRPLKPKVLVCDAKVAAEDALLLNLEEHPGLGIRRSLKPAQLPAAAQSYLSPRQRMVYFFEPATVSANEAQQEQAA